MFILSEINNIKSLLVVQVRSSFLLNDLGVIKKNLLGAKEQPPGEERALGGKGIMRSSIIFLQGAKLP